MESMLSSGMTYFTYVKKRYEKDTGGYVRKDGGWLMCLQQTSSVITLQQQETTATVECYTIIINKAEFLRKMVCCKISFLLFTLLGSSDAFVPRESVVTTKPTTTRQSIQPLAMEPTNIFETASIFLADASTAASDYIPGTSGEVTYSRASYYTILALYGLSFPGLWSTIKRSTSAKIKRKTYVA
jgi:hypothetical protein